MKLEDVIHQIRTWRDNLERSAETHRAQGAFKISARDQDRADDYSEILDLLGRVER